MVPAEVREALQGRPGVGAWNPMLPLITVDDQGYPHVCLLSQAQLDADDEHVYAVVASPTTIANLTRTGRATLVVVTGECAIYTKLDSCELTDEGDWLGVAFTVAHVKRDGIGVRLVPPRYLAADALPQDESWERSERVLVELEAHRTKKTKETR